MITVCCRCRLVEALTWWQGEGKSSPHPAIIFALTPVMPMNKGIEPMGEGVRVKTATTFICEKYFSNQEWEVEPSFVRFILIHNFQYLFPYFDCVSKKTYIFAVRFQPISVMEQAGSGFYFLYGVKAYYLSILEIANPNKERWYGRYSTWTDVYQHIRKRCVIYKRLTWVSAVIIIFCAGVASLKIG